MKKIYLLLILLIATLGFSQETNKNTIYITTIPTDYYNTAIGTGYTLKTQLKKIIDNSNDGLVSEHIATDPGYSGLWTTYQTSDRDIFTGTGYENDNTVYDIYTENPTGPDVCSFIYGTSQDTGSGGTSECQFYNREHIIPQSVFNQANPMHNDAHFIPPADKHVNGVRADNPHGNVLSASWTSNNGSKLGSSAIPGYSGTVFEPNSAFKGDIARMYFYFATRYQIELTTWGTSYPMFNGTNDQVFTPEFLNMLLTWHTNDPVSVYETTRNNAIYARQNNRNPYIDHPEYVCQIWSTACAALNTNSFELIVDINVYPNPSNDQRINIETENELDTIQLININGQIMQEIKKPTVQNHTYTLENLPKGFYFLKLSADTRSITKKVIIN